MSVVTVVDRSVRYRSVSMYQQLSNALDIDALRATHSS
jgi:hypothetical protein